MDYNQTVHLPQTDFPMRAGLPKREPDMLQEMYDHDLYNKMVARNDGKPTFVLHDGPPTPTATSTSAPPSTRSSRTSSSKRRT